MRYKFNRLFRVITIVPIMVLSWIVFLAGFFPYWIWVGSHLDYEVDVVWTLTDFLDKHFPIKPKETE